VTNEAGVVSRFGYDGLGRLTGVTNAWGTADALWATYGYDEAGSQVSQRDALGRETKYEYGALGRRTKRTLPGQQYKSFGKW
jgi:YD repeat-containing protein